MTEDDTYRKLFVAESIENHENIVNNLLILENGSDDTAIDEIFRAAHTLKGMSASMGFDEMETLCHSMEDVLHLIRSGERCVDKDLIDTLLACTDIIEEMLDDVQGGGDSSSLDSRELSGKLKALLSEKNDVLKGESGRHTPVDIMSPAQSQTYSHHISLVVDEASHMKDIRALLALGNLKNIGQVISCSPSVELLESSDAAFNGTLEICFLTDSDEESIRKAAMVSEISEITIVPYSSTQNVVSKEETQAYDMSKSTDNLYKITITVSEDSDLGDVRALIAYQNLADIGQIISSVPSPEELDNGKFSGILTVILSSDAGPEALHDTASGVDIRSVLVESCVREVDPSIGTLSCSDANDSEDNNQTDPEKTAKKPKKERSPEYQGRYSPT